MARVAWLSAETPDRDGGGGQRRQYFQIRALVDAGIDLRVAALAGDQDDATLRDLTAVARFAPGAGVEGLLDGIDRAIVAHVESVPFVHAALARRGIPWLLDFQNVNSRWHRARRDVRRAVVWSWRERAALGRATLATACSREERAALLALARGARVEVAGNGIAPEEWPDQGRPREPGLALFGSWTHSPNREGGEWLAREVWPAVHAALPHARLLIAGPGQPPEGVLAAAGVQHLGRVDDLAQVLGGVSVAVVPIVAGIGARVKFGEALASGAAVVSTSAGAEGFDVDGAFLRADGAEEFAAACIGLLRDSARAAALGRAGRSVAFERLTWDRTSAPLTRWALSG